ncbi:hypothetical protein GGI23_001703 [Coemansia sp. RSA 2559]|nr:hypothetical protein GGI23_001703 [Coemansia sp. RSA 2559]
MTPHVYFLIDSSVLDSYTRVVDIVTRVLVYLASENDAVTWNYEVADLGAACKEPRTPAKRRRVAERRALALGALAEFSSELRGWQRKEQTGGAVLGTLTRRLMCLEADVEWGDPALMRSPTRTNGSRTWADPTRLNEPMMLRNYLFIVGHSVPQTLAQVGRFVRGRAQEGEPLMDTLEAVRDGLVGNGLWESYARKRVGVSWIQADGCSPTACIDPVDLLIRTTFECSLEALGGSVLTLPASANGVLPLSTFLASALRTHTYPAWSRKFAREISAIAECFDMANGFACAQEASWEIELPTGRLNLGPVVSKCTVAHGLSQRLASARLLRRYSMAELVALASALGDADVEHSTVRAKAVSKCGNGQWHCVVDLVSSDPVYCEIRDGCLGDGVVLARADAGGAYVVVVPGPGSVVLVYPVDEHTGGAISDRMREIKLEPHEPEEDTAAVDFAPAWLESWACFDADLSVVPAETCSLDVRFDQANVYGSLGVGGCALGSGQHSPRVEEINHPLELCLPAQSLELAKENQAAACLTLESWYAGMYLRTIPEAAPQLGAVVDALLPLIDAQSASVAQVADSVLLSSMAIEDAFDASGRGGAQKTDGSSDSARFVGMRQQALNRAADAGSGNGEAAQRMWQLHECQLQIVLHLVCLANMQRKEGEPEESAEDVLRTRLAERLRDLVDLLCVWASVDGLAMDSDGVANDLAAAFVGGPDVGRFAGALADTVEELRVQCGWVPQPAQPSEAKGISAEGKRRKGTTPRRISRRMDERSEVIVHQRGAAKHASSRRIARHLDELICGAENRPAHAPHSHLRRLPEHLVRQIKSEVVMTLRPPSGSYARSTVAGSSGGALFAAGARRSGRAGKRTPVPDFAIRRSTAAPGPRTGQGAQQQQHLADGSLETPRTKRQRVGGGRMDSPQEDAANSSPLMLFSSPSQRTASHYIFASDGSSGEEDEDALVLLLDQSPLLRRAGRRPLGQHQEQQQQESHRTLEF